MNKRKPDLRRRGAAARYARLPLASAIYLALGAVSLAQAAGDPSATEAATALAAGAAAQTEGAAAEGENAPTLDVITVTSQKRAEDVQKVPISITVFGPEDIERQQIRDFDDYARLLPSVSFQTFGPGFAQVYMRGVASGGDGNHSGSLPSVGIYLDEQPITTIQGALDLHIYDIERVEALSGPQGTLYGASSEAGTIRIITNKPDASAFSASYGVEANTVSNGGQGYITEGHVNVPISENMAFRVVGWNKYDAGYIDNVFGTRTYPTSGITDDNADRVKDDYNDVYTRGARAALKIDLNDNWTITPTIMAQSQFSRGSFGYDPDVGELEITHFYPERFDDDWRQAALTVEGKIGNFDLVYSFAHLKRDVESESDYNDYGYWYDTLLGYGVYFVNDDGDFVNPAQYIQGRDDYAKRSHELRLSSPKDNRLRFVAGVFWQQQSHDIQQRYKVDDLADSISVTGWPDTIWLTKQVRQDHDEALFGEVSFDFTEKLTGTAGMRFFKSDNSLKGFFGFSDGYSSRTGEAACFEGSGTFNGAPCVNLDKNIKEEDHLGRVNLTYQIDDEKMIYGTWSEGFRPGGINRRGTRPPYVADFLTSYEFGFKTLLMDRRLALNGAVFRQDWEDFQFSFLGPNGLTEIRNAPAARINGAELAVNWAATYNLQITAAMTFLDSELTKDVCETVDEGGNPVVTCDVPDAPKGTRLPVTAKFKGNATARYSFNVGEYDAYWQGIVNRDGRRSSDLRVEEAAIIGDLPSYVTLDLSAGIKRNNWTLDLFLKNALDERGELYRFAQCAETVCGEQTYTIPIQPRTFGIRFTQSF